MFDVLSREFDYLILKFDLISLIFWLHRLSTGFCHFLKNVKTPEPKTYITILSIPSVNCGRNIEGYIFPTLCHIYSVSLGPLKCSLSPCDRFMYGGYYMLTRGCEFYLRVACNIPFII